MTTSRLGAAACCALGGVRRMRAAALAMPLAFLAGIRMRAAALAMPLAFLAGVRRVRAAGLAAGAIAAGRVSAGRPRGIRQRLRAVPPRMAGVYAVSICAVVIVGIPAGQVLGRSILGHIERVVHAERIVGEVGALEARAEELERDLLRLTAETNALRRLAGLDPIAITERPERRKLYADVVTGVVKPATPPLTPATGTAVSPPPGRLRRLEARLCRSNASMGSGGPDYGRPLRELFYVSQEYAQLAARQQEVGMALREASGPLLAEPLRLLTLPTILPVHGRLTSEFSPARRHPVTGRRRPHPGVDLAARPGTPIVATAHGRVTVSGRRGGYGLMVEIDHGHGFRTRYAHASRVLVRPGQPVQRGDTIARVGSTGLATGPHVHYEVLRNGRHVDPADFVLSH
jgi:murein DD-endopeptidase MepM/ murein hydrolase activator NlpD